MNEPSNARQQWSGVFISRDGSSAISAGFYATALIYLWLMLTGVAVANCPADGELQWGRLAKVVDGDTLHLEDGRKLRLIAVNAPELGRDGAPDQPLAREARSAVEQFFAAGGRVGMRSGVQPKDRYGRRLVHIFRGDGQSLSAFLLARGLAWRIAVPPNLAFQDCLDAEEQQARTAGRGVWSRAGYLVKPSGELTAADAGFALVRGTVKRVSETRSGWWIELEGLSLRLNNKDLHYFDGQHPKMWQGRQLMVRGWIVDRSTDQAVKQRGYAPLMMSLRHPSMLVVES